MKIAQTFLVVGALAAVMPALAAEPFANDPEFRASAAAFSAGNYGQAAEGLARLLVRYPRQPWLQMLLADAYERAGRLSEARETYLAALNNELDARSRTVANEAVERVCALIARNARPAQQPTTMSDLFSMSPAQVAAASVVYPERSHRRTRHFDITTNNPVLADVLAERVDRMFAHFSRPLLADRPFAHRVELIVYPDHAQFSKAHPVADWSGGCSEYVPLTDGSVRRIIGLYQIDAENRFRSRLLSNELPHEMTHVVLREFFGYARRGEGGRPACPLWLDEGLAGANEFDGGASADKRMRDLLAKQLTTPLADMIDKVDPAMDRPAAFYAHATSFTRFLRANLSDDQMRTFLSQIKAGHRPSVALGRTLVLDDRPNWLEALEQRWHKSVLDTRHADSDRQ